MRQKPSFIRPKIIEGSHPIETGVYLIGTPATFEMFHVIKNWIDMRQPGGIFHGLPRFGKTRSIQYTTKLLLEKYGSRLPVTYHQCSTHKYANEDTFYSELLSSVNHLFSSKGKTIDKKKRLIEYLRSISDDGLYNRIVLFIDEAQNLHTLQYQWLVDLFNELDIAQVKPTFVLVGQNELVHHRNALVVAKQFQIVGRFMVNSHPFCGLRGPDDIKVCLNGYDEKSEYPMGSGWTYTRFYFPVGYAHGWRFACQVENIWQAFLEIGHKANLPTEAQVPMQYFCTSLEYLMRKHYNLDDIEPRLSLKIWKEAVTKSGFGLTGDFIAAEDSKDGLQRD